MNMMEFTFDDPVQMLLDACKTGERLPVSELLARLDGKAMRASMKPWKGWKPRA